MDLRGAGNVWVGRGLAVGTPVLVLAAFLAGHAERSLFASAFASVEAAALGGAAVAGGSVMLALLLPASDIAVVAAALAALQRGLAKRRHHEAGFPWTALGVLADANALCMGCSLALGAVTVWGSVLGMFLWILQSGE